MLWLESTGRRGRGRNQIDSGDAGEVPFGVLRFVRVVVLFALGCDSLASPQDEPRQPPHGSPPTSEGEPTDGRAGGAGPAAPEVMLSLGGGFTDPPEPEPEPDLCVVAGENGAIFCEPGPASLEYCVEAPPDDAPCAAYDRPPEWLRDLLIQCTAHCGVGIATSDRELEGACCYFGKSEYYGR